MSNQKPSAETIRNLAPTERIQEMGHRAYIGGGTPERWYSIGRAQYHFLIKVGLLPHHKFLDIGCGSLRLGQFLIPYLENGHYFGLEPEGELISAGLEFELTHNLAELKKPRFASNYDFDFSFCEQFDFAIAQSVFTHLTEEDIQKCFHKLKTIANSTSQFFFTLSPPNGTQNPQGPSHANRLWRYDREMLSPIAETEGWQLSDIALWQHSGAKSGTAQGSRMIRAQLK